MDSPLTPRALARTYDHPSYADPWDAVEDYERVQRYHAEHPDAGRTAVGAALDLPPSRVRGWINGGQPDCVRAIDAASDRGWFDADLDSDAFGALNELVAAVFSGGTINAEQWVPAWTDRDVTGALDRLGVEWELVERDEQRADEIVARDSGSILGRVLAVLGTPVGEKTNTYSLPTYLARAPGTVRERFVAVYLRNRGVEPAGREHIQVIEERPQVFRAALGNLFDSVLATEVSVKQRAIHLRGASLADIQRSLTAN